jgi:hypothetical protein
MQRGLAKPTLDALPHARRHVVVRGPSVCTSQQPVAHGEYDGMEFEAAKAAIIADVERNGWG